LLSLRQNYGRDERFTKTQYAIIQTALMLYNGALGYNNFAWLVRNSQSLRKAAAPKGRFVAAQKAVSIVPKAKPSRHASMRVCPDGDFNQAFKEEKQL